MDSSTFNQPLSLSSTSDIETQKANLKHRQQTLQERRSHLLRALAQYSIKPQEDADLIENIEDIYIKLEQIEEQELDIEKQLNQTNSPLVDTQQLEWLKNTLIESWNCTGTRGRVLFFHHPPYVTEATKWDQAQTMAVRHHLRLVFNEVASATACIRNERSVVDLVLNGHAHCFEYLETGDTGHADSNIPWIICGGSGFSLRRQRTEGSSLTEQTADGSEREIARSHAFLGRSGHGSDKRRAYSFLNVTVKSGDIPSFEICPHAVEKHHHNWSYNELDEFVRTEISARRNQPHKLSNPSLAYVSLTE